jgi:tRNA(Ile2) C34 agmatinyltransferase TiaS
METRKGIGNNSGGKGRKIIICTEDDFKKEERPPCPECGEPSPISAGDGWKCRKCGRVWVKQPRRICSMVERPNCPDCGEREPWSAGRHWQCGKCGRWWVKKTRRKNGLYKKANGRST